MMARIRSIKPEFFTSEVIASLPLSARLTFIGLWTYVDDNGVGLDNARLIVAAIWPLEEDAVLTVQRTREDLRRISGAHLITRYQESVRRYLHITAWDEHQKVSHPRKPRYPLPTAPTVTCIEADPPETLGRHSGEPPEPLRPEQGTGSRDIQAATRPAADQPRPGTDGLSVTQRSKTITDAYYAAEPMCKWPAVNAIVIRAIKDGRWPDDAIEAALLRMAADNRSVTIDSLRIELNGLPPSRSRQQAETDELFDDALARARARDARENEIDSRGNRLADQVRQGALPTAGDR